MKSVKLSVVMAFMPAVAMAQEELYVVAGEIGDTDLLGFDVSRVGDVNGDGVADFVAGGYQATIGTGPGYARVFSGADGTDLFTVFGDGVDDDFGWAVSGAGDVNADGTPDFIVGAPEDDNNGFGSGSARVFSGADASVLYTFHGDGVDDNLGIAVSAAGDVNNDGFDDVIVGATVEIYPLETPDYVRVFSGKDGSVLHHFSNSGATDKLGYSVDGGVDFDQDGFDDLVVGAPFATTGNQSFHGAVHVYSGQTGNELFSLRGDVGYEFLGYSVTCLGDLSGDGVPDFAGGAWDDQAGAEDGGSVRVWSGASGELLATLYGEADQSLGYSLESAGDVDQDGFDDLIAASYYMEFGRVSVYSGQSGVLLHEFEGAEMFDSLGEGVASAGDLNADGIPELLIGVPGDESIEGASGTVRTISLVPPSPWTDLGQGLAGTFGVAELAAAGSLEGGSTVTLTLTSALPNTGASLVFGFSDMSAPFQGGVMVPFPDFIFNGLPVNGAGELTLETIWPEGVQSGTNLYFQYWFPDPAGVKGLAASNAVQGVTP